MTLLMFAHPRCPCTRASLHELALIMSGEPQLRQARVVFCRPAGDRDWTRTDVVSQATGMTGVEVLWDDEGRLAQRFGVRTSGHVLVYDEQARLSFSGGVTGLRGHEGWNAGRAALLGLGRGPASEPLGNAVRGCSLVGASTVSEECQR